MKDPMRKAEAHLRTMNASSLQTHRFSMSHPSLYGGARRRECFEMAKSRNWHVCVNARRGDSKPDTRMHNCDFAGLFKKNGRYAIEMYRRKCYVLVFA
jgi:hypothetical protein